MEVILLTACNLAFVAYWARYLVDAKRTGKLRTRAANVYRDKTPRAFAVLFWLAAITTTGLSGMLTFATALELNRHLACHNEGAYMKCAAKTLQAIAEKMP